MILLFRHGQTLWNQSFRMQGGGDSPLTDLGQAQARAMGAAARAFLASRYPAPGPLPLQISPLGRTRQTAALIADELTRGPSGYALSHRIDARLREMTAGDWEGQDWREMRASLPPEQHHLDVIDIFRTAPGGEGDAAAIARLDHWLDEHAEVTVPHIVVSHGIAGIILRGLYLGLDEEAMFAQDRPQDAFYVLTKGQTIRVPVALDKAAQ